MNLCHHIKLQSNWQTVYHTMGNEYRNLFIYARGAIMNRSAEYNAPLTFQHSGNTTWRTDSTNTSV